MTLTINIPQGELDAMESQIVRRIQEARPDALRAMRDRFYDIVVNNFGIAGAERPWSWHELSPEYAEKVGRTYATLEVTGALKASLMKGGVEGESTTVSMSDADRPYATAHHDGSPKGNRKHPGLPGRRVFPIEEDGSIMPWTQGEVQQAALDALARALK